MIELEPRTLDKVVLEEGEIARGTPTLITATNTSHTLLTQITIGLEGEGAERVQLARDEGGKPGVWAAEGEPIRVEGAVLPGGRFIFWARGVFTDADAADLYDFRFVIDAYASVD